MVATRAVVLCEDVGVGTGKEVEGGAGQRSWMTENLYSDEEAVLARHGGIGAEIACLTVTESAKWIATVCLIETVTGIFAREIGIGTKTDGNDLTDGMTGILGGPIVRTANGQ
jgi:hypothetical protein